MNISVAMTKSLIKYYQITNPLAKKKKRNGFKQIVDSLIEQIYRYYFRTDYPGHLNGRIRINLEKHNYNNLDLRILESLLCLIVDYDNAFSKTYSDYSDDFNEYLNTKLRDLLLCLREGHYFENQDLANELRGIL